MHTSENPTPAHSAPVSSADPLRLISGHASATSSLQRALDSDRLHHAYLFHGPSGIGKRLTALCFAQTLLCADPQSSGEARLTACGVCKSCARLIRQRAGDAQVFHPDLRVIERELNGDKLAKEIKIQPIRELQKTLSLGAFEEGRRVVIIDEVDRLGLPAANALLKTLEEPLPDVHFLLLTTSLNSVLPTIKSRAQAVRFAPLPTPVLRGLIERVSQELLMSASPEDDPLSPLDPAQIESLAQLSGGSIGRAMSLYQRGGLARAEEWITAADRQGGPQDALEALKAAQRFGELSERDLALWLHLMRCWYRDALILMHSGDVPLFFPAQRALTAQRARQLGFDRITWRLSALDQAEWHLLKRTGSNRKLILETLLLYLAGFDDLTGGPLTLT